MLSFASAAAALSCTEKGGPEEGGTVKVSPGGIDAPSGLCIRSVEVTADCSWTVSVAAEDGNEVSWAVPDRAGGKGNATVNVRIYANKYKDSRTAVLTVSPPSGDGCRVMIVQAGDPSSETGDSEIKVRAGTYNLRISTLDNSDPDNNWNKRKDRLMTSVKDNDFDFFGVQECDTRIQNDLKSSLGDIYTCKFFSPYSQDGNGDKAQGLLYKTSKFTLSDWHRFWASANPDVLSVNDTGDSGSFSRGGCCGVLTHKDTGIKIFVMVTHACLNKEPNARWAPVYAEMEKKYNPSGYPSIFVGDMNAKPSDPASAEYRKYWTDVYSSLPAGSVSGPSGTFNGFNLDKNMASASRLDYIYCRGAAEPESYVCNNAKYGGFYASDHLPIYSDMRIKSAPEQ